MKFIACLLMLLASESHALTAKDFVDGMNGELGKDRERYVEHFGIVLDVTMEVGVKRNILCFPTPMPSRARLLKEFLADIGYVSLGVGGEKIQIETLLPKVLLRRYPCVNEEVRNISP